MDDLETENITLEQVLNSLSPKGKEVAILMDKLNRSMIKRLKTIFPTLINLEEDECRYLMGSLSLLLRGFQEDLVKVFPYDKPEVQ